MLGRAECGLCEQLTTELDSLAARLPLPQLRHVDVDSDPELRRRFGLHVPVLLLDGIEVCRHRLDVSELHRLLRR